MSTRDLQSLVEALLDALAAQTYAQEAYDDDFYAYEYRYRALFEASRKGIEAFINQQSQGDNMDKNEAKQLSLPPTEGFTPEQVELIRSQVAPDATNDELKLFLYVCKQRGLDPLTRQIYAIHRKSKVKDEYGKDKWILKMTIQTSIDGFRSLAERTGTYAPGEESWENDPKGFRYPRTANVSVKKFSHGKWLKFSATAHWDEYAQTGYDGKVMGLWDKMPHVMLAKVAEAKALRKGWPEQLGGLYTSDEMLQADKPTIVESTEEPSAKVQLKASYPRPKPKLPLPPNPGTWGDLKTLPKDEQPPPLSDDDIPY